MEKLFNKKLANLALKSGLQDLRADLVIENTTLKKVVEVILLKIRQAGDINKYPGRSWYLSGPHCLESPEEKKSTSVGELEDNIWQRYAYQVEVNAVEEIGT